MKLIQCKACGGQIADDAEFCPHCGHPTEKRKPYYLRTGKPRDNILGNCLYIVAVIVAIAGVIVAFSGPGSQFLATIVITAAIVFVMISEGTLVHMIQATYDMMNGLTLSRDEKPEEEETPADPETEDSDSDWIESDRKGYAFCPRCGEETAIGTLQSKHACPNCGREY